MSEICRRIPSTTLPILFRRFRSKLVRQGETGNGCAHWQGAMSNGRAPHMRVNGKILNAVHVAWMLHRGEIPPGTMVRRSCETKLCLNPDHLYLQRRKSHA